MSKAVRGTKRHCRNCGAKFYDLGRYPIVCPICHAAYESEAQALRGAAAAARSEPEEEVAPAAVGPEIISLEDADAESGADVASEEEDIPDLGDVQQEIPEAEGEDVFLEEEEEDESDVSGFIGGQINSDEER